MTTDSEAGFRLRGGAASKPLKNIVDRTLHDATVRASSRWLHEIKEKAYDLSRGRSHGPIGPEPPATAVPALDRIIAIVNRTPSIRGWFCKNSAVRLASSVSGISDIDIFSDERG